MHFNLPYRQKFQARQQSNYTVYIESPCRHLIDDKHLVRDACEKWGVFQFEIRRLFSLPTERKQVVARFPGGYTGYDLFRISPSPVEHASQLWPEDHAKFCGGMEQFQVEITTLCEKLVAIILCDQVKSLLQLNSYPMCPDADRAMGLAPHTDSSLFILYQGNINGLQFYEDDMEWLDDKQCRLSLIFGALIVNIGDLMFKLVLHSVVANNTRHRISKWFFYLPPWDDVVLPLKKLVEFDRLPMYRTVIWKEYVEF
ncbi:hypothetical protein GOBAR_AA31844 [Gossypium barbadense]|uniref:Fe2OG dioxygenase domain-containing protein n=1 Tax=Gossypium barbadense TaxID=3634 RepID=A0A2P5WCM9_GOSBA|nr:hypothetical protein GOBAR_AA31844 [Gossypium barbadense]